VPRIGDGSADALAGSLPSMMDLHWTTSSPLILDPSTGNPSAHRGGR
jgi:hypothetical protein